MTIRVHRPNHSHFVIYSGRPLISTILNHQCSSWTLTELEAAVNVLDALRKVDVAVVVVALAVAEVGTEDRDLSTALNAEGDVLGALGEV